MRGVAFRFEDLRSLFHYSANTFVKGSESKKRKKLAVAVPKKVYQLTHNYRSHDGKTFNEHHGDQILTEFVSRVQLSEFKLNIYQL